MLAIAALCLLTCTHAAMNNPMDTCQPSDCHREGDCYCTDISYGWYDGGSVHSGVNSDRPRCMKARNGGFEDCQCTDCGNRGGLEDVQCIEWRCDDETGITENGKNCYEIINPTDGLQRQTRYHDKDFCYKTRLPCQHDCPAGQYKSGCKRTNPGVCKDCAALGDGNFFGDGECNVTACRTASPGEWIVKACSSLNNADVQNCLTHPGNNDVQAGVPAHYCPGNGLAIPVPTNARPTSNYAYFECLPGYYFLDSVCIPCSPGFYCANGRSSICPENYYAHMPGQSNCDLCTVSCDFQSELPMLCKQGSTSNAICVPCGMCSFFSDNGHNCVQNSAKFKGMPLKYP